jgi:uncharacterized coiled-coil DUF342 family protein
MSNRLTATEVERLCDEADALRAELAEARKEAEEVRKRLIMSPGTSGYNRHITELEQQLAAARAEIARLQRSE